MRAILVLGSMLLWLGACTAPAGPVSVVATTDVAALELVDMGGQAHALADDLAAGRRVVLVFWETWCESCRAESATLVRLARSHPELAFYGVVPGPDGTVDDGLVLQTALQWHLPYPQVRDRDLRLTEAFGVQGTPTVVVIGPGGEVLHNAHELPTDWGAL